ncbi:MAG TPA: hypothetical protein V6D17_05640 [Candidatus Obscuribacterales bacterium]
MHGFSKLISGREATLEPFRAQMETWFANIPESKRVTLHGRLRSPNEITHTAAFYELFFHEFCRRRHWTVEIEPHINRKRPDFYVRSKEGSFILEVLSVWRTLDDPQLSHPLFETLYALDALSSRFLLEVEFHQLPGARSVSKICALAMEWLACCDDQGSKGYTKTFHDERTHFTLHAIPRQNVLYSGSLISWQAPQYRLSDSARAVARAMKKSRKYLSAELSPLVHAVCTRDNVPLDEVSLCQELFGDVDIYSSRNSRSVRVLSESGRRFGPNGGKRLSAIIFCTRRWDLGRVVYDLRVIHNPWATCQLPVGVFLGIPQLVQSDADEPLLLEWMDLDRNPYYM